MKPQIHAGFDPFPDSPEWVVEIDAKPLVLLFSCSANGESAVNLWIGSFSLDYSALCEGPSGRNYFTIGALEIGSYSSNAAKNKKTTARCHDA